MHRFHQIPTDQFVPISHDNSYLFTHYDKVANFLAFNLDKNYKSILAKPVQNGYTFDWFSGFEGLINIKEYAKAETDSGLIKYWEFIEVIEGKIEQLENSTHDDGRNWASLLNKVFNHQDNFIFSNGKDISIVWGWKFDNNEIYKPDLRDSPGGAPKEQVIEDAAKGQNEDKTSQDAAPIVVEESPAEQFAVEQTPENPLETTVSDGFKPLDEHHPKAGFLEFLRWFAAKFWWLLWLLTFLITVVFIVKTTNVNT